MRIAIKTILLGVLINGVLALIKGLAGYLGNSYALIADALESTSDIFTSVIVYLGYTIATKEPDKDHPYGHGKAEPIATILVSWALVAASIIIAIESIHKIQTQHPLPEVYTLFVLGGVVLTKELLFRYVLSVGQDQSSNVLKADAWHHRSDAISSAVAFIGITIALLGGKGYEIADDIAALFGSLLILYNAFRLFSPALGELMDAAPAPGIEGEIRQLARNVEGVKGLDKCFVRKMGIQYYVDLHVLVNGEASVKEGHRIAHDVKNRILSEMPIIYDVLVHIEPV